MNRRSFALSALAVPLPFGAAQAQTRSGRDHELQHVAASLSYGAASIEAGRLALDNTRRNDIRRFAGDEIAEQQMVARVLRTIVLAAYGVGPQQEPKIQDSTALEALRTADPARFDAGFVAFQLNIHRELMQAQENYLSRGQEPLGRAVAMMAQAHIADHLGRLTQLQQAIADGTGR